MVKTGNKEQDYLLILLRCALKGEKAPMPDGVDMKKLFALSNSQQVYNTVLPCLQELGVLSDEESEIWNNHRLSELQRTIFVNNEREQICSEFDEQGIKYMFLKGLVLRELYPQSLMRQMSDNDILFDASRRDDVEKIMLSHGFYLSCATDKSDDYYKEPNCLIELHRELFNHEYIKEIFTSKMVWDHSVRADDNRQRYIISPEDNYAFTLLHMFKHYIMEGCGIRFLCDMYLLDSQSENLDFNYIDDLLKKINENPDSALIEDLPDISIPEFKDIVVGLSNAVFNDKEISDEENELLTDMLSGAVYGQGKSLQTTVQEQGGKFRYILHKVFPSKAIMYETYRVLEKKPYLLFYYYIKHFFYRFKHKKSKVKKELDILKKL